VEQAGSVARIATTTAGQRRGSRRRILDVGTGFPAQGRTTR
jgi:hypothetical protein